MENRHISWYTFPLIFMILASFSAFCQTEVEPWGNLAGVRVDGQLMEFSTQIVLVQKDGNHIEATRKEQQRPKYSRSGDNQIIRTHLGSLSITEIVNDVARGKARMQVQLLSRVAVPAKGVYLCLLLPRQYYQAGTIQLGQLKPVKFDADSSHLAQYLQNKAVNLNFSSPLRQLKIRFKEPLNILYKARQGDKLQFWIPLHSGDLEKADSLATEFDILASGLIDQRPVTLTLDTSHPGRKFDGLGGNFRLQNPKIDPEVIDYCLKNLRVAWGRVEMPWMLWQPSLDSNPIAEAMKGKLNEHVRQSMEMARRLYRMGIPVILSAWFPPQWAVIGSLRMQPGPDHIWGNSLDPSRMKDIYKSIGDYLQYLKDVYRVEVTDFSFNESDLGINVRQTGQEHDELIKGLGAYFASRGFKTKLLLGDNSDANSFNFILPAMEDSAAYPYIGAISFHSWRGWDPVTLQKWRDASLRLHRPLLIAEGSIDAAAWTYPAIFQEQSYAIKEISLYLKLISICQPESILQWQLTSDYSLLAGGGVFGDTTSPLHPTQRFWNLKQLASTPKDLKVMRLKVDGDYVSGVALGDNSRAVYAIHIVNNGAARNVTLTGLPSKVKFFHGWVTDGKRSMEPLKWVAVRKGRAEFKLKPYCFTSLEGSGQKK